MDSKSVIQTHTHTHTNTPTHTPHTYIRISPERLLHVFVSSRGLFAGRYTETHYLEDGSAVSSSHNSTTNCYYHGEVEGRAHSDVSLSTCTGFRGLIWLEDRAYVLEPSPDRSDGTHRVYRAEHLVLPAGSCGHHLNLSNPTGASPHSTSQTGHDSHFRDFSSRRKRDAQTTTKYVELIIVADNREFQKQGKDMDKVKQRLAEIANYVDKFYRALNIRVALVGLEVWSDTDKCPVSPDPFTTLHDFLDWRKVKLLPQRPHDNAQLISGVYFQGTTIGMAPIMSMCTAEQSGGIVMDHSDNPLGAAVTLAHELGHNFGMNHDTPERGCGCRVTADRGGCIMTPSTGYPFPTVFSSCSKKDLAASFEKGMGMCLFNMPEVKVLYGGQKCGNGYVEEGEECDCGEPEECLNPCCNATTCTLKGEAVCAHGQCCHDCQLKLAGTPCRESSHSCDLPEYCTGSHPHCPANVYLHDGHACHSVDGYCYNGICQTHEQQCITLWGPGAKAAPGICFKRVNSAGDPYGNCGKDSKGSFAKCEARDAKCGKIQCQGGATRPVIGTNAVSIETNIPLQEGGRILCRGTHVYLGDDMPDPGLVLTGTKCGDGMMCLNRQCQNVSVFSVQECSAKCSGRGKSLGQVTVSLGHAGVQQQQELPLRAPLGPPRSATRRASAGSVDSGPMRLADSRGVIVGGLGGPAHPPGGGAHRVCEKEESVWPAPHHRQNIKSVQWEEPVQRFELVVYDVKVGELRGRAEPVVPLIRCRRGPLLHLAGSAPPHSASIYKVNKRSTSPRHTLTTDTHARTHARTYTRPLTHTHTHTQMHTCTHTDTHAQSYLHTHTHTQMPRLHTRTLLTHKQTQTHTHRHVYNTHNKCTHAHTDTHADVPTCTHTHTNARLTHTHTTHTTHPHTHTTHTQTDTDRHIHTDTYTHTHTQMHALHNMTLLATQTDTDYRHIHKTRLHTHTHTRTHAHTHTHSISETGI
ncbi:Disintegrin and metalloproteinase domain-containing protein 12 [Merluccius polli]|uniref:Disintegrin and metalloproteinase domain-containing protein 12 n=1 Tax=Merluccius polli TaxID=89951 RepID=A0AA47MXA5_MERPO|nr:Disintegrin and metalloproteinase domain-containing protein 12 [Merluccius polli]